MVGRTSTSAMSEVARDRHELEQGALLRQYYLHTDRAGSATAEPWSADGPSSISPFVPCAASRIPLALRAARLGPGDCLWDLGCGDGRLLHQACAQYGCECVGVDIDAPCIDEARARAAEQGLGDRCKFACCDLTALEPGALRGDASGCVDLGAASPDAGELALRAPTCVLIFVTGHGLTRLQDFLRAEWERGGLRILTCVESLESCCDFEAEDPLFDSARHDWPVHNALADDGIYVVPPLEVALDVWARDEPRWAPAPPLTPAEADTRGIGVLRRLLSSDDIAALNDLGSEMMAAEPPTVELEDETLFSLNLFDAAASEADVLSAAEDCWHTAGKHRVVHLHRAGRLQATLPRLLERVLQAVRAADAKADRLLVGRAVGVRSAELHIYGVGGAVSDPQHRDMGSLLTLSALLTPPDAFEGAAFTCRCTAPPHEPQQETRQGPEGGGGSHEGGAWRREGDVLTPRLGAGDAVLFASEKQHNVTPLTSGARRAFVLELWAGPTNAHNRHR